MSEAFHENPHYIREIPRTIRGIRNALPRDQVPEFGEDLDSKDAGQNDLNTVVNDWHVRAKMYSSSGMLEAISSLNEPARGHDPSLIGEDQLESKLPELWERIQQS